MKRILTFITLAFLALSTQAQISHGGQPYDWQQKGQTYTDFVALPGIDRVVLQREDDLFDQQKDIPWRFGVNMLVDLDINNSGIWTTLNNGDREWRLSIKAKNAVSINFVFDQYHLPEGGEVFVYDREKKQLLGSFTNENANSENELGVGFIFSDQIIISYREPVNVSGQGYLHINNVTHGYRNAMSKSASEAKGPFGNSAECNVNVNCPAGLPFGIQKRSVGIIVVNNNGYCTGALVNTTAQDDRPYFLTANHCGGSPGNWIFYFNHETPDCEGELEAPTNQSVSGATLLANNAESDFRLVELNSNVPTSYNVCYSGWDATDNPSTVASAYGIHHPAGDVKKISIEEDIPFQNTIGGFSNQVWFINQWELGVTQGGSSGSPLFNQSGLIIGQLSGGTAGCNGPVNNGGYDFYGRLGVSWDFGSSSATRLKDWLDPINTGEMLIPNSCQNSSPVTDATLVEITGIDATTCNLSPIAASVNVLNSGSVVITSITLNLNLNGINLGDITWTGSIDVYEIESIELGNIFPALAQNNFEVSVVSVNGGSDAVSSGNIRTKVFYGFDASQTVALQITFDDYPLETSWRLETIEGDTLVTGYGNYTVESINESYCLGAGCYRFTILDSQNDGICCSYGNGSYSLIDAAGTVVASGGNFNAQESTEFCITSVGILNPEQETVSIYPNPTSGKSALILGDTANSITAITVIDAVGKVLSQQKVATANARIWTFYGDRYNQGVYFIRVETTNGDYVKRVVVVD